MKNYFGNLIMVMVFIVMFSFISTNSYAVPTNLALTGTATQSSDWSGYAFANRAIDGNTNGNFWAGSVSHTNGGFDWWQVDLGGNYAIDNIVIWNRTDCCGNRLTNFEVKVSNSSFFDVFTEIEFPTGGGFPNPTIDIDLPTNPVGRYVRIQLKNSNYLQLAEVQVFEAPQTSVPEPASILLLGIGLVGMAVLRRKIFEC